MSITPRFILIGGNRVVGKDTFCNILRKKLELQGVTTKRIAFADPLKEMLEGVCNELFKKNINDLTPYEKELFRPLLLSLGKLGRELDIDFWVKLALRRIDYSTSIYIFTDVRYLNEYQFLVKEFNSQCHFLWIDRIGAPPPTIEEAAHGPILKAHADLTIEWPTFGQDSLHKAEKYVIDWMDKVNLK